MREIKFRGKRTDNGEWVYGFYVGYSEAMGYIYGDYIDKNEVWKVDAKTVGEFTGLHDKNGKEIYEGDVVLHDESDSGGDYEKFIVSFGKHHYDSGCYPFMGFGLDPIGAPDMDRHYRMFGQDEIEVIGNIHVNPELLNAH